MSDPMWIIPASMLEERYAGATRRRVSTACDASDGERKRVAHALDRLEAMIGAMRLALKDSSSPVGLDGPQAILTTAGEIMAHVAAADAHLRGVPDQGEKP